MNNQQLIPNGQIESASNDKEARVHPAAKPRSSNLRIKKEFPDQDKDIFVE